MDFISFLLCIFCVVAPILFVLRTRRKHGIIAFFHPYCNAGGGGERVLWCAVRSMQKSFPSYKYIIYTGDRDASKEQILLKARQRFGIELDPTKIDFVYLGLRRLVEADLYPRLTMLAQAIAGGVLAIEALLKLNPEIMIDSMGYPLSLPVFKILGGSRVVAYIHYPTISCDMIDVVETRQASFNNSNAIAQSNILTAIKIYYYRLFAFAYWLAGKAADGVMVNGRWTRKHIESIWSRKDVSVVYPPCDVDSFLAIEPAAEQIFDSTKLVQLLSVGQIRPEKNHRLQIEILKDIKETLEKKDYKVKLIIAGGCRNSEDEQRVKELKKLSTDLGVESDVDWMLNVPYEYLMEALERTLISIHTMHNEHFGISVVEGMAAGTIILANDSGGPQTDIVHNEDGHCVGYLAATKQEYCHAIENIVNLSREQRDDIRKFARVGVVKFDEEHFEKAWNKELQKVLK